MIKSAPPRDILRYRVLQECNASLVEARATWMALTLVDVFVDLAPQAV